MQVADSGFGALKTNIFTDLERKDVDTGMYMAGFGGDEGGPALNAFKPAMIAELVAQMKAFREGAGAAQRGASVAWRHYSVAADQLFVFSCPARREFLPSIGHWLLLKLPVLLELLALQRKRCLMFSRLTDKCWQGTQSG
eukprot:SAG11_NODE_5884_length_1441_cov_1.404620_3_plen_140_part_00